MSREVENNEPSLEEGLLANDEFRTKSKRVMLDLKWQLLAMCLSILTQGYLMLNVISYVGFMCIKLVPGLNANNSGSWAGFVVAMFMIGRSFSSYAWGELADKIGRKKTFYLSFALSIVFSIGFAFSSNIWMAMVTRFLLGASNSLVSAVKTVVTELSEGDKALEGKMMGFVFGMRGWAFFLSPSIAGYLSDPVKQFPNSYLATRFTDFLTAYPYVLPNLFGVLLIIVTWIVVYFSLKETKIVAESEVQLEETSPNINMASIWAKPCTRNHLIAYWLLLLSLLFFDGSIPFYLMATSGGLSLQEKEIGSVLFTAGLVYGAFQYFTYYNILNRFGLYGSLQLSSIIGTPLAIVLPIAGYLNRGALTGSITWQAYIYLVILIGCTRVFTIVYFSGSSLGANQSVEPEELSIMNGISMLGGSVAQAVGPSAAGLVTSFALTSGVFVPYVGVYLAFSIVTGIGLILTLFTVCVLKKHYVDGRIVPS